MYADWDWSDRCLNTLMNLLRLAPMSYYVNELPETGSNVLPRQWAIWDWPRWLKTSMSWPRLTLVSYHANDQTETGPDVLLRQWTCWDRSGWLTTPVVWLRHNPISYHSKGTFTLIHALGAYHIGAILHICIYNLSQTPSQTPCTWHTHTA